MQTSKNIYQFFEQYNGILTTKEINENHIDRKQLNKMAHKGEVNLMKQSVYWWEKNHSRQRTFHAATHSAKRCSMPLYCLFVPRPIQLHIKAIPFGST
jgi:hypothetical protein